MKTLAVALIALLALAGCGTAAVLKPVVDADFRDAVQVARDNADVLGPNAEACLTVTQTIVGRLAELGRVPTGHVVADVLRVAAADAIIEGVSSDPAFLEACGPLVVKIQMQILRRAPGA